MKLLLKIGLLFLSLIVFGQEQLIYVEYDHGQFISTFSNKEILIAGKDKSRYDIQEVKEIHNRSEQVVGMSKKIKQLDFSSIKPTVLFKQKESNIIYFDDFVEEEQFFIKDTLPTMNWELIPNESKEIQGYIAQKAKLKYRGSEFTAYYTTDIPTSFGPWKFDGLPGLILEITLDDDATFYWRASNIIYPYAKQADFKFNKEKYSTSMRTFIKKKEFYRNEKQRKFDEKFAQGAIITRTYNPVGPEKVYEWEK